MPPFTRVLLIESGSRDLLEDLLPGIYEHHGADTQIDLLTCYTGTPGALSRHAVIYRTTDYAPADRPRLLRELLANQYSVVGIICSAEPILYRWKLWLGWKLPGKIFILNENGDYFWLDRHHWSLIRHFLLFRMGLTGAGAIPSLLRLLVFPFTVLRLAAAAAWWHFRRRLRSL